MALKEYKHGAAFPGTIGRIVNDSSPVTMDVSGELITDEDAELRMLMARQ